jgi:hypothetical protein
MSDAANEKVRVVCHSCGARFKAPAAKAGKKGPCPKCGILLVVPQAGNPADADAVDWSQLEAAAPRKASAAGAGDAVLAMAAVQPADPPARPPATEKKSGGFFSRAKKADAPALAGLSQQQRELLTQRVQQRMKKDFQRFEDETPGSLPTGIVAASFCAIVGAGLWFGLFAGTGKEIRWMAIAVGILAGGGMYLGYQRRDIKAGYIAAGVALAAIVGAKVGFVGWGERFKVAAKQPVPVSKVEQEIEDEFLHPDPDETFYAVGEWTAKQYMYENDLTPEKLGAMYEWDRERHQWKMNDKRDALSAEEGFNALYRWTFYSQELSQRQRDAEIDWEAQQQARAAEQAMAEDASDVSSQADVPAGADAGAAQAADEEDGDVAVRGPSDSYDWSPEKRAAMEKLFAQVERDFFMEVQAMEPEVVKKYWEDQREVERRARKIAAKQAGEDIQEKFVELGEDPVAAAQAEAQALKYQPFDVLDLIAIPFAAAAALFLGRGWD